MDNLKSIWNQLSYESSKVEISIDAQKESIFEKLEYEEKLRTKYNPFLIVLIILFVFLFGYIVSVNNTNFGTSELIGIAFVTLASIVIATFSQIIKIPLNQFEYDKSSMDFLKIVKHQLNKSKKMLILGSILQIIFLTIGLYLIIFYNSNNFQSGHLYTFFAIMSGIGGAAVGGCISFFNTHYKYTYQIINHFLKE